MPHSRIRPIIHAAQSLPGLLDCQGALERACELIVDASMAGADWILFPETCIPGYPSWVWSFAPRADGVFARLCANLLAEAIAIPSNTTDRLCRIAERSRINVIIGLVERAEAALYNTLLVIDAQGRIVGRYHPRLSSSLENAVWLPEEANIFAPNQAWGATRHADMRGI